jgi:septum formation protein
MAGSGIHSAQHPADFILASASPRRAQLLAQVGLVPTRVVEPSVDETPKAGELPAVYALRVAQAKARAGENAHAEPAIVLAADTVVACGRRILPKAADAAEVMQCLHLLSGRRHQVLTAVAVIAPDGRMRSRTVTTRVGFKRLSKAEIIAYAECREGEGKAGGYAIQGRAGLFVHFLNGSYSNVVGLPLYETAGLLQACGMKIL